MIRIYTMGDGGLELASEYETLDDAKADGRVPGSVETEQELLDMFDGPRVVAEVDSDEAKETVETLEKLFRGK